MLDFRRKANRLPTPSYRGHRICFLTLCAHQRKPVFRNASLAKALTNLLEETCRANGFGVYAYCFMPDHLHLILVGEKSCAELSRAVRTFKGTAAAAARARGISNLWQKGFYDHVVRGGEGLDRVAWYVFMNPVRAGLAKEFLEWPFSGSFMVNWKRVSKPAEPFVPAWKKSRKMAG